MISFRYGCEAMLIREWEVTCRQRIVIGNRHTPDDVDTIHTVWAKTKVSAIKCVRDAGKGRVIHVQLVGKS